MTPLAAPPGRAAPVKAPWKLILVGYDGSASGARAVAFAMDLAALMHAEVFVLHAAEQPVDVIEPVTEEEMGARRVVDEEALRALARDAERGGIKVRWEIREGNPVQVLLDAATESSADLIVVGTRGLRGTPKVLLGSVSSGVVAGAKVPVTVLH